MAQWPETGIEQAQANLGSLLEYWFSLYSKTGHIKTRAERRLGGPKSKPGADGPLRFSEAVSSLSAAPLLPCSLPPSSFLHS